MSRRKEDASRLAREAELSNLRMQLQPHFLFNSLNSISALISSNPEQARTMIQQLSDFLRGTAKKGEYDRDNSAIGKRATVVRLKIRTIQLPHNHAKAPGLA